jgi:CubicO group peptidase (beta-lactamase class C family)
MYKAQYYLIAFSLFFQWSFSQINNKILDNALNDIYKQSNFPGFALAIVKGDSTYFAKGYGFADKATKTPYSLQTIQPIGSVSKTFIGLAVIKAIEMGYFTMETNINDLLPFKVMNPNFPNDQIKIKHLVTHTSSLIDKDTTYMNTYGLGSKPKMYLKEFIPEYYSVSGKYYSKQNFSDKHVGTTYAYSNIASALMAYIIEVKSNMFFFNFTEMYLLQPMKMKDTDWYYDFEKWKGRYATLYMINKPEIPLYYELLNPDSSFKTYSCVTYPDGSLKSNVSDLTKYLKTMIAGYSHSNRVLNEIDFDGLFKKQFTDATVPAEMDPKEPNRAVFWSYSKRGQIRHTGSDAGVFAFIAFNPKTKVGTVMTMNTELEGEDNVKSVKTFLKIAEAIKIFEESIK